MARRNRALEQNQSKHGPPSAITRQPAPDRSALTRLLDEWMHGAETEQRETFAALRRSLDEDRPDGYKLLDAAPLGMITNPKSSPENEACKNWLASLVHNGADVIIPEIAAASN